MPVAAADAMMEIGSAEAGFMLHLPLRPPCTYSYPQTSAVSSTKTNREVCYGRQEIGRSPICDDILFFILALLILMTRQQSLSASSLVLVSLNPPLHRCFGIMHAIHMLSLQYLHVPVPLIYPCVNTLKTTLAMCGIPWTMSNSKR